MRIAVCVAAVPNLERIKWDRLRQSLDAQDAEAVLNPVDRGALELAAALAKSAGTSFAAICAGAGASAALREAAVFGAERLTALVDPALDAADEAGVAAALAAALRHAGGADVVLCGARTSSFGGGTMPGRIGALLNTEMRVDAISIQLEEDSLMIETLGDDALRHTRVAAPVVIAAAAYGIKTRAISPVLLIKAGKKAIDSLTLADADCPLPLPTSGVTDGPLESNRGKRAGMTIPGADAAERAATLLGLLRERRAV